MNRRQFLASLALQVPAFATFQPVWAGAAESGAATKLPAVHQITRGPRFHWFGYYDKFQFSADNRFVLGNEVDFEGRSPQADDVIRVGMVDLQDNDR